MVKAASVVLLVGALVCLSVQPLLAAEGGKVTEKVLHSFGGGTDGKEPGGVLLDVNGTLYGVTSRGGSAGKGTVFSVNAKTGAETVLYSFCSQQSCADGASPEAGLIDVNGILYGTTSTGGIVNSEPCSLGCGTIFSINPQTGAETVLYAFCSQANCTDGSIPQASLLDVDGLFYGTTAGGGSASNAGTMFSFDPNAGTETALYSFCSQPGCADGDNPYAPLIAVNGTLYSTTGHGGAYGQGTVFAFTPGTRSETVLHSFCSPQDCSDGMDPEKVGVIYEKGTLYGTTTNGGGTLCGTVYSLDPNTDKLTVLHAFQGRPDGCYPTGLLDAKGTLYGTTDNGGTAGENNGGGTVFSLDPKSGAEAVVYSFCSEENCTDGEIPNTGVIDVKGVFYGTTAYGGGVCATECGVVFSLKNP